MEGQRGQNPDHIHDHEMLDRAYLAFHIIFRGEQHIGRDQPRVVPWNRHWRAAFCVICLTRRMVPVTRCRALLSHDTRICSTARAAMYNSWVQG